MSLAQLYTDVNVQNYESHIDHGTIRGQRYHTTVEFHKDYEKVDKINGKGGELSFSNIPL